MNTKLKLLALYIIMIFLIVGCGSLPPKKELAEAKKWIEAAEKVDAKDHSPKYLEAAKKYLGLGEKKIQPKKHKSNKDAKEYLDKSRLYGKHAYNVSAPMYAREYIRDSEAALYKAREIKANVAVKQDYNEAYDLLESAKGHLEEKEYNNSITKAKKSKTIADKAYQVTLQKKNKSATAIEDAEVRLKKMEN